MGVKRLGVPKHVNTYTHARAKGGEGGGGGRWQLCCVKLLFLLSNHSTVPRNYIYIPMLCISGNFVTVTSNVCFRPGSYQVAVISLGFSF